MQNITGCKKTLKTVMKGRQTLKKLIPYLIRKNTILQLKSLIFNMLSGRRHCRIDRGRDNIYSYFTIVYLTLSFTLILNISLYLQVRPCL